MSSSIQACARICLQCVLLALAASVALAQSEPVTPPRVVSMPEIALPADVQLPESGRVEVEIIVAADGGASLDRCDESEALCAAVKRALEEARFEPASRAGTNIAARVRIALRLPQPAAATAPEPPPSAAPPAVEPAPAPEAPQTYGARGRVNPVPAGARRLELAEVRDLPGAFGDPFRAIEALPGVVPILSGVPFFFIRGSPPAGSLYIYDGIPVPSLYHLAVGPAAIHPRMVGPITLYSGVAPARYGRLTGGAIVGEGPETPDGRTHAEAELRLLDVSGYVQTEAPGGGTVTAAVRYGYPALLFSIFSPEVTLAYWDYQLRYVRPLSAANRFELVALGSYDSLSVTDQPAAAVAINYHRIEPRFIHRLGRDEFGAAFLWGWEQSEIGSQFQLKATRYGPRLWYEHLFDERNRLRLSADMQGISGDFSSVVARSNINRETSEVGLVGNVQTRSIWGVQAELNLRPWTALEFRLGARGDAWVQSGGAQAVVDPRVRVILHASESLDLHVAAGIVHQPAVFYVPLPGIADLANDAGLQTALQSELGVGWDTPLGLRAEVQLFLHRYENLVFLDTLLLRNALDTICSPRNPVQVSDCQTVSIPKRIDGFSYGAELFLRRAITERLSGFLSYTLAFSAVDMVAGLPYTPSWDVRHVANLVLQWQIGAGFSAGVRWFLRSGKIDGQYILDATRSLEHPEQRLPGFMRLDLEAAYAWPTHWGKLRVALEWFNATLAREPIDLSCSGLTTNCHVEYLPAIFFPNLSVRGEH